MTNTMPPLFAMRDVLLDKIHKSMAEDDTLFFVSADFGSPVLDRIRSDFPERFVNVGIAEQNLINVCSGLALEGFKVFAYGIAPFITMRAFEQIRVNLALLSEVRELTVNLIGVGAGFSYALSGPTHQCYEDISIMRSLPNIEVISPADAQATVAMWSRYQSKGIRYIRLDAQLLPEVSRPQPLLPEVGFSLMNSGQKVLLISTGYLTHTSAEVVGHFQHQGQAVGWIDMVNITHFDRTHLANVMADYQLIVTLEEGFKGRGGLDASMQELMREQGLVMSLMPIGVPPQYSFELGGRAYIHEKLGLGADTIIQTIHQAMTSL